MQATAEHKLHVFNGFEKQENKNESSGFSIVNDSYFNYLLDVQINQFYNENAAVILTKRMKY